MVSAGKSYGIVILAAGRSSRLGRPKQLLTYHQLSLVQHAARTALDTACGPVVVVTGAFQESVTSQLYGMPVELVFNPAWEEGMASSLRKGLDCIRLKHPETNGVIFMVCDQPFVTKSNLLCLIDIHEKTGKAIAASHYGGKDGTPAFFHHTYFHHLMELKGDNGARGLMAKYAADVESVPFEKGILDIDTLEDYEQLLNS